jgi:hypothetical protein
MCGIKRLNMSPKQYRDALARYGLTQGEAGWLFGGKSRESGRRWAAEGPPYHVALLLTLMQHRDISPTYVEKIAMLLHKKKGR